VLTAAGISMLCRQQHICIITLCSLSQRRNIVMSSARLSCSRIYHANVRYMHTAWVQALFLMSNRLLVCVAQ
jgi:hypothetical protein